MRREELVAGEVYAVRQGPVTIPMLLASVQAVTVAPKTTQDGKPVYRLSAARARPGTQGPGLAKPGGSVTGVLAIAIPTDAGALTTDWLATGDRMARWINDPPVTVPTPVNAAYLLARRAGVNANFVARSRGTEYLDMPTPEFGREYTVVSPDGESERQRRSAFISVVAPRQISRPWVSPVRIEMSGMVRELRALGLSPYSFAFEAGGRVSMSRESLRSLLDMIPESITEET